MDEAERFGYSLAIRLTRRDVARRLECVKKDQSSGADGMLLAGELDGDADPFFRELHRRNYPLLTFCCPNVLGFFSLTGEGGTALSDAVRSLAGAGHRRILFGACGQGGSLQKYAAAFAAACREFGVGAETVSARFPDDIYAPFRFRRASGEGFLQSRLLLVSYGLW